MKKVQGKTKKKIMRYSIFSAIFLFIVLFSCYSFAIAKTTTTANSIKDKKNEIQALETEIIDLETEYFEIINSIDRDNFSSYGLEKTLGIKYISINDRSQFASNF